MIGGVYMISWKDEYKIGVETIDNQHKKLFEIANTAYELLKNDTYIDKYDRIVQILEELKEYTKFHFKSEEEYMESIGYKRLLSQKVAHNDFIDKIYSINLSEIDENQDEYILEILDFIVNWISVHILESDMLITKA
mgnify:CR=1 FL=1|jgi:hemerythrin